MKKYCVLLLSFPWSIRSDYRFKDSLFLPWKVSWQSVLFAKLCLCLDIGDWSVLVVSDFAGQLPLPLSPYPFLPLPAGPAFFLLFGQKEAVFRAEAGVPYLPRWILSLGNQLGSYGTDWNGKKVIFSHAYKLCRFFLFLGIHYQILKTSCHPHLPQPAFSSWTSWLYHGQGWAQALMDDCWCCPELAWVLGLFQRRPGCSSQLDTDQGSSPVTVFGYRHPLLRAESV